MKKKEGTLLIVDDNRNILTTVKMLLDETFANVWMLANPNAIPATLREKHPDVVLLDMNFRSGINTGNEGLYWLREIKKLQPQAQVVLFTAYADIELAVTGLKEGATDFIVKPFDNAKMIQSLRDAYAKAGRKTTSTKQKAPGQMYWGESDAMQRLRTMVEKVAITDANILITGENGTGKEMLAQEIHRLSARNGGPIMPIDMGAITETLFEGELFGHMKGSYTDAHSDQPGKFEQAEGGTLFLDEIGNLSYALQAKLLTTLQRRTVVRLGSTKEIPINVRLICATNRDLPAMVQKGQFREDLLYRINTIHLELPPLRERRKDIVPLAERFLQQYATQYNKQGLDFDPDAKAKLTDHYWAGNIRELQHTIEKTVILCDHPVITASDIELAGYSGKPGKPGLSGYPGMSGMSGTSSAPQTLEDTEREAIATAIRDCEGNLSVVATRLGISRQTLYNKIKRYGL